jgi:hypothetical protein
MSRNKMNLLSFAANAVSPVSVPSRIPVQISQHIDSVWSRNNFFEMFLLKSGKTWITNHTVTPAAEFNQLSLAFKRDFEKFIRKKVKSFDLELEYCPNGFIVNREYLLNSGSVFFLCCRKKIDVSALKLDVIKNFVHGSDFEILCFVVFLSRLSFSEIFNVFFTYGTSSSEISLSEYVQLNFQEFIEIFSDVQIPIEDVFVKRRV